MSLFDFFDIGKARQKRRQELERILVKILNRAQTAENLSVKRRRDKRNPVSISVEVALCDEAGNAKGESVVTVTRDLTMDGLAFISTAPLDAKTKLLLTFECDGEPSTLKATVAHSSDLGRGVYLIGCNFDERLQ